ncbi:hypothetical protein V4V36_11610 [Paenibacillus lautus]|uniref:hypothetical protein n=1 Tax=Paenibacillus TaxID=44249 RepID=UPI001787D874|nr:hypothetical protein [Paenibacillus sp. JNUCC-32]QOT09237.1 hypothetical protein JNUCC32_24250 [Paenibacillus sp. JNUCC-32]
MNRNKTMTLIGKGESWKATYVVSHQDRVNAKLTVFQDALGGKLKLQYSGKEPLEHGQINYRLEDMTGRFQEGGIVVGTDHAAMKETKGGLDLAHLLDMMNPNKDLTIQIEWNGHREEFKLGLPRKISFGKAVGKRKE